MVALDRRIAAAGSFFLVSAGLILAVTTVPGLRNALLGNQRKRRTANGSRVRGKSADVQDGTDDEDHFGILLFYEYAALADVPAAISELEALCKDLGLCGRLRVSEEGFNGNLSGEWAACKEFIAAVQRNFKEFAGTDFKLAPCQMQHLFRNLKVWESDEVCGLFASQEGVERVAAAQSLAEADRGKHLSPQTWHEMMSSANSDEVVLFDVRNRYETRIGHFSRPGNATDISTKSEALELVDPNTRFFHEVPEYLAREENIERFRGKKVMMYCTGGVRCERASALLKKQLGSEADIYQLAGGIQRYLEAHPDGGFFQGSMHVFDRRGRVSGPDCLAHGTSDEMEHSTVIGRCVECSCPWDRYQGKWRCKDCGLLVLVCASCQGRCSRNGKRNQLRCELCNPEAAKPADELPATGPVVVQQPMRGPPPPPRLLTFTDRAEKIAEHYEPDIAIADLREFLRWMHSRRLRERISSNPRALKALRAFFEKAQQHEDTVVVLACAEAIELLLRDPPVRAAICRAVRPLDMALSSLAGGDASSCGNCQASTKAIIVVGVAKP